ncbi:hypothetical protein NDU88_000871 [Pleurodeles waltl]|uniref:Uncharacterized protein n=1 Tax=Pleurodeles waltl TaxID=8319 RepID=A0AAV7V6X1_PLEWA|nr:hypothetical protein NDU88_000871 [Pleurodeles waltl]
MKPRTLTAGPDSQGRETVGGAGEGSKHGRRSRPGPKVGQQIERGEQICPQAPAKPPGSSGMQVLHEWEVVSPGGVAICNVLMAEFNKEPRRQWRSGGTPYRKCGGPDKAAARPDLQGH